jgi:hypothetical protein
VLARERGERLDETLNACLGVADRNETDDADKIAHLRSDPEAVAERVFGLVPRDP